MRRHVQVSGRRRARTSAGPCRCVAGPCCRGARRPRASRRAAPVLRQPAPAARRPPRRRCARQPPAAPVRARRRRRRGRASAQAQPSRRSGRAPPLRRAGGGPARWPRERRPQPASGRGFGGHPERGRRSRRPGSAGSSARRCRCRGTRCPRRWGYRAPQRPLPGPRLPVRAPSRSPASRGCRS